jgi:hypothetical protein
MVVRGVTRAFLYSVAVTLLLSAQYTVADHFDEEETEVFDDVDAGGETKVSEFRSCESSALVLTICLYSGREGGNHQ